MNIIFLKPELKEKIWGGNKLHTIFGMEIPSEKTGEAWVISGHKNGITTVISPEKYSGRGLDDLYENETSLFYGNDENKLSQFPLLVKILDANDKLSVQVHPDDDYASKHVGKNELGKNECWYILDAEDDAEIVYGHNAKTKEEFTSMIEEGDYDHLLKKVKVKKGDFFNVPSGTIHAIGAGIVILETQQSSDTTFRVYDYDRIDDLGNKRELHIKDSINVTHIPHIENKNQFKTQKYQGAEIVNLVANKFFVVKKIDTDGVFSYDMDTKYALMNIIEGKGSIELDGNIYKVKKGDSFIIPYGEKRLEIRGNLTIIESTEGTNKI